jgi:hypothetical protein
MTMHGPEPFLTTISPAPERAIRSAVASTERSPNSIASSSKVGSTTSAVP